VLLLLHVDEIDDDDAAEVAEPQLSRDRDGRLEVRPEDRLLEVAVPDVGAVFTSIVVSASVWSKIA
jgi:hypothetical protein